MEDGTSAKSAFVPALVTFVVVSGAVFVVGFVTTWVLRHVILPLLALILGFLAARIVYKIRD